jgi:peptide/nickel transport system substrate-binding protein
MRSFHRMAVTRGGRARPARLKLGFAACGAALAAAASLVLAACGGQAAGLAQAGGGSPGEVLTVGFALQAPPTLDPGKAAQNYAWLEQLAYEPLIVRQSNGSLTPGLATSWSYTGTANTVFALHLRPGVKFSDGSTLTAQGVADHLSYVMRSGGQLAPFFAGCTFTATGPLTVTIRTPQPDPDLPQLLTQDYIAGDVISPDGLHSPSLLGTRTAGAGPYMLDQSQTITGDHYTYVPNPHYYDKAAVYWKKVVVRIITDPQSMLNALKTGQVQVSNGDATTMSAAGRAGLTITSAPLLWTGVTLADRGGTTARPLADLRVRQALNYATDRTSVASGLFPGTGSATSELTVPGGAGYDRALADAYPYDPGKAKQLLAAAGYPHGFTLKLVTGDEGQMNLMAQALAQQWQKVGVNLQVTDYANSNQYFSAAFGRAFPAFMTSFGQLPVWMEGPSLFLPPASFNPFHTSSPQLAALYAREARSSGAGQASLDRQIEAYLVHQAWFVPVVATGLPYYGTKAVAGVATSAAAPLLELYQVRPAG